MKRLIATIGPYLGALILFFVTISVHRSHAEKKMRNALAQHARVFAPFLWNLEKERAAQTADIVMQVEGYESIRVEHPTGAVFLEAASNAPLVGFERVLRSVRLIDTTTHAASLVHDKEVIGRIEVVKVNREVYVFAVVIAFLALIAFAARMGIRNLAHKKALAEANLKLETARRQEAELALLEREKQLFEVRRLENLGRLASGLAHDLNNILTVIICNTELLLIKTRGGGGHEGLLQGIADASERASRLTRQLLSFAGRRKSNPEDLSLNDIVEDMRKMLSRMLGDDIELVAQLAPGLLTVRADRSQIEQIVMNLVVNARDAIAGGGRIRLETRNVFGRRDLGAPPGDRVKLLVTDDGEGMDEETRQRAFEPFFTTKRASGTGLGLTTVHSIVEQCGGTIDIASEKGKGTTVEITFPCCREEISVVEKNTTPTARDLEKRRFAEILVVEDQAAIREVLSEAIIEAGYSVVQAKDGDEGLEAVISAPRPFDLIITDVNMPGISGIELCRRAKSHAPQTKVLCMSGHMSEMLGDSEPIKYPFIAKPFTIAELLKSVEAQLETEASRSSA